MAPFTAVAAGQDRVLIYQLDLAFEATGSIQPLINASQRELVDMIEALTREAEVANQIHSDSDL